MIWRLRMTRAYGLGRGWVGALLLMPALLIAALIDLIATWRQH